MNFDIENFAALRSYLKRQGHIRLKESLSLEKLEGGVSNRTVHIRWPDGRAWVLKQALPKLRVEADWFSNPGRIRVEARALQWLNHALPQGSTPAFILADSANNLFAMEAVPEPHENWKRLLLAGHVVPDHFAQSAALLAAIHRRSTETAAQMRETFAETTHFESLRLQPYYIYSARQVPEAAPFLCALATDTLQHKICLVHGDFSPKNILIRNGKLVLLDHEVMHFGEPAFDLGFVFAHFLSKAHHVHEKRAEIAAGAVLFWHVYQDQIAPLPWSTALETRAVRHTLACLLARVAGKSPLEYLSTTEKDRQRNVVLPLMAKHPATMAALITQFTHDVEAHAKN